VCDAVAKGIYARTLTPVSNVDRVTFILFIAAARLISQSAFNFVGNFCEASVHHDVVGIKGKKIISPP
jgi:hypothetical protein